MVKQIFVLALTLILLQSCVKGPSILEEPPPPPPQMPTADFVLSIGSAPFQSTVTFYNRTKYATDYKWDFGDNTTSTEVNPVHFYQTGGTYKVKLTANSPAGSVTAEKNIVVSSPYTSVVIKSIVLLTYWEFKIYDFGSDPDIYVVITDGASVISSRSTPYTDVPPRTPVSWTLNNKYTVSPLSKTINIAFWDADDPANGDPDDLIDQFSFKPIDYTTGADAFTTRVKFRDAYMDIEWE